MCNAYNELVWLLVAKSRGQKPFIFPKANQQRTTSRRAHIHSYSEWLKCPCWATSDSSSHEVKDMVRVVTTCSDHLPAGENWRRGVLTQEPTTFPFLFSPRLLLMQGFMLASFFSFRPLAVLCCAVLCCVPLCSRNETAASAACIHPASASDHPRWLHCCTAAAAAVHQSGWLMFTASFQLLLLLLLLRFATNSIYINNCFWCCYFNAR